MMKISIITVCLNSASTIEQTIESVLVQKDKDVEYVIVDGGSTDGTLEIINKYRNVIDIVISEPDNGIYDAMNKGISLAQGDIIGIINSDDWYEQEIFEQVRETFSVSDAGVVYGKMNLISENGDSQLLIPTDIEKLRYEMEIPHSTVFIKKNIYEEYGLFSLEYKIAADYELMLRYYSRGVKFVYLNEILANFRLGGMSCQQSKICAYETLDISKKYISYCPWNKRETLKKIMDEKWAPFFFRQLLDEAQNELLDYIKKELYKYSKSNISIFGAGRWGMDMTELLVSGGISPLYLVDNKKNMWGKLKENIEVFSPDVLKSFNGILLILAKGFSEDILLQVKNMKNPLMICITWEELTDELKDHVFSG